MPSMASKDTAKSFSAPVTLSMPWRSSSTNRSVAMALRVVAGLSMPAARSLNICISIVYAACIAQQEHVGMVRGNILPALSGSATWRLRSCRAAASADSTHIAAASSHVSAVLRWRMPLPSLSFKYSKFLASARSQ